MFNLKKRSAVSQVSPASIAIAALSTMVEWYDFTLYLYFATVLSGVFFGGGKRSLLIILSGFAITYLLRPLGALFFSRIGDQYGRRQMMMLSMALMTGTMLLTALLPTYQQMGMTGGVFILLLRGVMAFSVGGEYTGVVAYLLEGTRPRYRGLMTSLASAASEVGALIAVAVSAITLSMLSVASLHEWGWRIPFILGALLAGTLWIARSTLEESPDFKHYHARGVSLTFYDNLTRYHLAIGRTFAISALGSVTYYLGITYIPVFLISAGVFSEKEALSLSTVAAIAVVLITPLIGHLSDRIGRRPVLIFLALVSTMLPLVIFAFITKGGYIQTMFGAVLLACLAGGMSAIGTSSTAEQFPIDGRLTGLALGTTAATALFGGLTPYIAHAMTDYTGSPLVPGVMIAAVALCVLPVFIRMPETAPGKKILPLKSPGWPQSRKVSK
ncbi:MFS transporter [Enterobacteriaceae bacterium LUAb1]